MPKHPIDIEYEHKINSFQPYRAVFEEIYNDQQSGKKNTAQQKLGQLPRDAQILAFDYFRMRPYFARDEKLTLELENTKTQIKILEKKLGYSESTLYVDQASTVNLNDKRNRIEV